MNESNQSDSMNQRNKKMNFSSFWLRKAMRYNPVSDDVSATAERPVEASLPSTNQNIYRLRRKAFIFITIQMVKSIFELFRFDFLRSIGCF